MFKNRYFLKRAKKVLFSTFQQYKRKKKDLEPVIADSLKKELQDLQKAILQKEGAKAAEIAHTVQNSARLHLKKGFLSQVRDFVFGIGTALAVAVLIRQMWFELYEIPTGSMRPTFKEQDRLSVSKTAFGINRPLSLGHFYFNPDLLKRNNIVIFTVEDMDFRDGDTVYFYLFPGKKLLVKRLIGKPGDTLYFYGGKIYGVDSDGKDISHELQIPELEKIDHIPFIAFEGTRISTTPSTHRGIFSPVVIHQMNEPIARLYALNSTQARGELLPKLRLQNPDLKYDELWGISNFAMARLLTKDQVRVLTDHDPAALEEAPLYLELKHHPNLSDVRIACDEYNRVRPIMGLSTSIIPLQESHLKAIMNNLYTARFVAKDGFLYRYGSNPEKFASTAFAPHFPGIQDGTYEFYYGKAYDVKWQGITSELPSTHPLYRFEIQRVQQLFNMGMELDTRFSPQSKEQYLVPSRNAYFRDGDLYLMGAPILKKDDPMLRSFVEREQKRSSNRYQPFVDRGPPIDKDFILKYGLKVPPKSYLVLGDNHANSGDSRDFGFVPEENLRGTPSFIFWPPGSRFGQPLQPFFTLFNSGRLVIWSLGALGFGTWYYFHRKRHRLPLDFD